MEKKICVSPEGMARILGRFDICSFASLRSVTAPRLNVKGREDKVPFVGRFGFDRSQLRKVSEMVIGVGYEYRKLIENRLKRGGLLPAEYKAGVSWHEPVEGSRLLRRHKTSGELYLFVACVANNKPLSTYVNRDTGEVIPTADLRQYLEIPKVPANQGLGEEDAVVVRTFKMTSIRRFKADNTVYEVIQEGGL